MFEASKSKRSFFGKIVKPLGVIIIVIFALSFIFGGKSELEEEAQWYKDNGYEIQKLDYADFLGTLDLGVTVDEKEMTKTELRTIAELTKKNLGIVPIGYDTDMNIIFLGGDFDPDLEIAYIFYWKVS